MYRDVALLYVLIVFMGCGLVKPTYKPYESGGDKASGSGKATGEEDDSETDVDCDAEALEVFTDTIQPSITQSCGSCHGPGGQSNGTLALPPGDAAEAQSNLWAYTGGDANKLIDKLSSGGEHSGGDLIGVAIEAANISTWVDAKASCL
jgi:mono/diheme cytochrome c family protein